MQDLFAIGEGYLSICKLPSKKSDELEMIIKKEKEEHNKLQLDDFILVRKLRSGNFGQIYAAFNKTTKRKYALKLMSKGTLSKENIMNYVYREEEILTKVPEHPFILKFYKMFIEPGFVILVIQLFEGEDLFDALGGSLTMSGPQTRLYISQVLLVIEHLHKNKIIYRDLKPENIMVDESGYLNLVDFGTAKKLTIEHRYKTMTIIGTPHYMAP